MWCHNSITLLYLHWNCTFVLNFSSIMLSSSQYLKCITPHHFKTSFITQEPQNHFKQSCNSQLLFFIKYGIMNCTPLSEWQFNFLPHVSQVLYTLKWWPGYHHLWGSSCYWQIHLWRHVRTVGPGLCYRIFYFQLTCLLIQSFYF